jgi:hypothetical protein
MLYLHPGCEKCGSPGEAVPGKKVNNNKKISVIITNFLLNSLKDFEMH